MRVISTIELAPCEWADYKRTIYKKLNGYSLSSVNKIITLMNNYGSFYSKKLNKFYEKISTPRQADAIELKKQYLKKTGGKTKESESIDLEQMKLLRSSDKLTDAERNWCIVSLGMGLRPIETDMIDSANKKYQVNQNNVVIYQSKTDNFKEVGFRHDFQLDAKKIVQSNKPLKRPSIKKVRSILGDEYGLYAFRKGYQPITYSLGDDIFTSSRELGHTTIDRTFRNYTKKVKVSKKLTENVYAQM